MEEKKYAGGVVSMDLSCNVIAISPISGYIPPHNLSWRGVGYTSFLFQWGRGRYGGYFKFRGLDEKGVVVIFGRGVWGGGGGGGGEERPGGNYGSTLEQSC